MLFLNKTLEAVQALYMSDCLPFRVALVLHLLAPHSDGNTNTICPRQAKCANINLHIKTTHQRIISLPASQKHYTLLRRDFALSNMCHMTA